MELQATKKKIVIGINSLVSTVHAAYSNHVQLFFKLGRNYPQYDFIFVNPPRMSIDRMRNMAATVAIQANADYLIFIDDDVLIPFNFLTSFEKMLDTYDIVCGNVQIRGYPFDYMMFKWDAERKGLLTLKTLPKNEIVELDAVGFSCCLIKVELLRKMNKPYFVTTGNMTEDVFFCLKARDEFPETRMACDSSIVCGHILWSEVISDFTRENYTKYYEAMYPEECEAIKKGDLEERFRGEEYLARLKASITESVADATGTAE